MSASILKRTGGVQLTPKSARTLMPTSAVQAHTTSGEISPAPAISGITVEQSPSGRPTVEKKGNVLGVSAQLTGGKGGDVGCGGGDGGEVGESGGEGGEGGGEGGGGDEGGEGVEGGNGGGEGDCEVKQTLKPPLTTE